MKLHPRHVPVSRARKEFYEFIAGLEERHALTSAELLTLLTREVDRMAQSLLADERRGDLQ